MKTRHSPILLAVLLVIGLVAPAAHAEDGHARATILHGVPDLTVDVYVAGDLLIEGFAPGESFGPAELPAGDYEVEIRPAGADPESDPAIADTIALPAGANATAIAHLDAEGAPTLSAFANDTSQIPTGQTRIVVRHTAAFGPVDILAGDEPVITDLAHGGEELLEVPAGTYEVAVTAAGDPATEALRATLDLREGTSYIVHAIGDPGAGSFDVLLQVIDGLHAAPSEVPTGTGPIEDGRGALLLLVLLVAAVLPAGVAVRARAARR